MGMKISEMIADRYKLRIPPTVYYELLADVQEFEERQEPTTKNDLGVDIEDAVVRLKAFKHLIGYDKDSEIVKATQKSLDMAIKALEQEPILDKIYADIQRLRGCSCSCSDGIIDDIEDIIDKYKVESEG